MTDRRTFLKALAASSAVTLMPDAALFGQSPVTKLNVPRGAIDVHHHFQPPGQTAGARPWTPELTLARMEKFNIGVSMWPFAAAKAFMPESHLLFGTDYSPEPIESTVNELPGLKLPRQFELALLRGNAERLFPKFKLKA